MTPHKRYATTTKNIKRLIEDMDYETAKRIYKYKIFSETNQDYKYKYTIGLSYMYIRQQRFDCAMTNYQEFLVNKDNEKIYKAKILQAYALLLSKVDTSKSGIRKSRKFLRKAVSYDPTLLPVLKWKIFK